MNDIIEHAKLITCIVPKGKGEIIQRALVEEKGMHSGNFHRGRGVGRLSPLSKRGIGEQQEKELFEINVPAESADELFEFMFFKGEMDRPHGGIIFMTTLQKGMDMRLPDLPDEDD